MKIKNKSWFTLVEMLIVIVIIGILAWALIPRLSSARWRANDTARKADLHQIAATLVAYQIDHGKFPNDESAPTVRLISDGLNEAGMSSVPDDPINTRVFEALTDGIEEIACYTMDDTNDGWSYQYRTISKNGIAKAGFALSAGVETAWWANRVHVDDTDDCIWYSTNESEIMLCKDINQWDTPEVWPNCIYEAGEDQLRYIYTQ